VRVKWLSPDDFDYALAMKYHGLMLPLLVMTYLLAGEILQVDVLGGPAFAALGVLVVILSGPASLANSSAGRSPVGIIQICGIALADLMGVILLVAMFRAAMAGRKAEKEDAVFWLLFCSISLGPRCAR